jgi:SPP1 family predicted phage head-tail adaptor
MRAGNLRERVTFQTKTEVSDGISAGGTETWTDTLTGVPAAIWPLKGDQAIDAMKLEHTVTHRVRVRYQSAITADMRIEWGSRYLDIIAMINLNERNRELEIIAEELTV